MWTTWWIILFIETRKHQVKEAKTLSTLDCAQQTSIGCRVCFFLGFFFMIAVIVKLNTLCFRKSLLRDKASEGCLVLVAFKRQGQILGASPWQRLLSVTLCPWLKCSCVKT